MPLHKFITNLNPNSVKGPDLNPVEIRIIMFGICIIGLHILCLILEALKLKKNDTTTPIITTEVSEFDIMEQKQDKEKKENKNKLTIAIISISAIMIFFISGGIFQEKFLKNGYSTRIYYVTVVLGLIALFVNLILFVIKEQYL